MPVSHNAQREPTRVDVWTVLKELPHRVEELLTLHEASHERSDEATCKTFGHATAQGHAME